MKKILLIFVLFFLFLSLNQVEAAGLVPCGNFGEPQCQLCHFFVMFDNIIKFLLIPCDFNGGFAPVPALAAFMIVIGGFFYIIAYIGQGGPERINQANALFKAVAIGLVIIYGAWLIISAFFLMIGVAEWTGLMRGWNILEFNCPS